MKVRLLSDLHLEFRNYLSDHIFDPIWENSVDHSDTVLLLAGDIGINTGALPFIEDMCKYFKHVIYILGNHEFYGYEFKEVVAEWKEIGNFDGPGNFTFLNNEKVIIDGVRFLGGTMWTDFNKDDIMVKNTAKRSMNDFSIIYNDVFPVSPNFISQEHKNFMEFLIRELEEPFDGPTVLMTHHSPGSIHRSSYPASDLLNHCYFADLENLIGTYDNIKLCVHGHTHENADYMINNTRVVCNPYGYWGRSENKGFINNLILEV